MVIGARRRGYAIVLGTFLLGGLCGAGVGYAVSQRSLNALVSEDRSEARDLRRLEAFTRELGLTHDQRERVRGIVERHRPERDRQMRRMFDECGQPLLRVKDAMDAEIRGLLTADQQRLFDAMRERRAKFFRGEK
ncbi:MAG TPA: hypothetical protein VFU02_21330 [Polyangiaceae bacterium]|nr:hypothetical protein [Polyangiaceae bacterium]